jgi:aminoglycoside phosphotransferase (APT) family kinase protein
MIVSSDTTQVRAGEEIDSAILDRYLRDHLKARQTASEAFQIQIGQFPGGHSNLTYLVRYGAQEFVLRRPPVGPVAPTAHDITREFHLLSLIHPAFPLAPKPLLLCEDLSVLGVPFYLMERRSGLIIRSNADDILGADLNTRHRLSETVVDTLADLHAVDIESSGIVKIGKPEGFVSRQVHGWADRWTRSKTDNLEQMDRVIQWLVDRIPTGSTSLPTVVHNDFKLDNIMLDQRNPSRVVALLDWEMSTVGDPLVDVGLFLCYWTMKGGAKESKSLKAVTDGPGWMTREEIIRHYAAKTGRDLSGIVFYETFARFKVAVVIQQIYLRYLNGQTRDERFRNFDVLVRELAAEALDLAQRSGI